MKNHKLKIQTSVKTDKNVFNVPGSGHLFLKRCFDVAFSASGLIVFGWLILLGWLIASLDTRRNGFFVQERIGRCGRPFRLIKLRTMKDIAGFTSTVTTEDDPRITRVGSLLRTTKLDELPQLLNVLVGHMSLVGPRPDVAGFADQLRGEERIILSLRPGITGPATIKYRDEQAILANQVNPEKYNRDVIFPDKIRINRKYISEYSFVMDLYYLFQTIAGDQLERYLGKYFFLKRNVLSNSSSSEKTGTWPFFDRDEIAAVVKVLETGQVNYWTGNEVKQFEKEFAAACKCDYGIAVANGTLAIELALYALNIGPGDEVIVPSRTFVATASAVAMRGAKPIIADIDTRSQNLTTDTILKSISPRTKGIIAVHLGGWPCEMEPILEVARDHALFVVEDCAQAHGATYKGQPVGSFGHMSAFSFCQDKIMSTGGEGGMLVTNNALLWERAWSYKDHGKCWKSVNKPSEGGAFRFLHNTVGTNWRLTEMQAAIGRAQLKKLPSWVIQRKRNAAQIIHGLKNCTAIKFPQPSNEVEHSFYRLYGFLEKSQLDAQWSRNRIASELVRRGVACGCGSCGEIYLEGALEKYRPSIPHQNAHHLHETSLAFCVHPTLKKEDIAHVVAEVSEVLDLASPSHTQQKQAA